MTSHILSLLVLFVAGISAIATSNPTCVPGKILQSESFTSPDGVKFNVTTSECSSTTSVHTRDAFNLGLSANMEKRGASECTQPEICVCGATCFFPTCEPSPAGTVRPADCQTLTNAILSTLNGTFFLKAGTSQTANSGSCEYVFDNLGPGEIEFCWDDLANLGHTVVSLDCPAQQASCQTSDLVFSVLFA